MIRSSGLKRPASGRCTWSSRSTSKICAVNSNRQTPPPSEASTRFRSVQHFDQRGCVAAVPTMRVGKRRTLPAITVLVTLAIGVVLIPSVRVRIMRAAGWALVAQDRMERADIIVVPKWTGEAGALEAAELVRAGIASRVAVLVGPQAGSTSELIRRGVIAPSEDWITRLTRTLGVSAVEEIPNRVNGTEAEGDILPEWCA